MSDAGAGPLHRAAGPAAGHHEARQVARGAVQCYSSSVVTCTPLVHIRRVAAPTSLHPVDERALCGHQPCSVMLVLTPVSVGRGCCAGGDVKAGEARGQEQPGGRASRGEGFRLCVENAEQPCACTSQHQARCAGPPAGIPVSLGAIDTQLTLKGLVRLAATVTH